MSLILKMVRTLPVVPVIAGGDKPFQPIWAEDAGAALALAAERDDLVGRVLELAGPEVTTYEQIVKQLDKLINVVKIDELAPGEAVERELLLATVAAPADVRGQVIELVGVFEGRILSVGWDQLTVALEGHPDKLDDFEGLISNYGIVSLQRTGRVALPKLERQSPVD